MAVKASVTITISKYRDTDSITRYYKLQASTAAAPAVPTTLTPSGWSTSEPTYTSGSTNTLYYTDCIVFSDGTFQYTDDGNGKAVKSSSYEAAKEAYNKAQAAQNTANTTQTNLNNLQIGGENLILNAGNFNGFFPWAKNGKNGADSNILEIITENNEKMLHCKGSITQVPRWQLVSKYSNNYYILKYDKYYCYHIYAKFTCDDRNIQVSVPLHFHMYSVIDLNTDMYINDNTKSKLFSRTLIDYYVDTPGNKTITKNKWCHIVAIWKNVKHDGDFDYILFRPFIYGSDYLSNDYYIKWMKLEEGNKPTDFNLNIKDSNVKNNDNLWKNSKHIRFTQTGSTTNVTYDLVDDNVPSKKYAKFDMPALVDGESTWTGCYCTYLNNIKDLTKLKANKPYTYSFYIKADKPTTISDPGALMESQSLPRSYSY